MSKPLLDRYMETHPPYSSDVAIQKQRVVDLMKDIGLTLILQALIERLHETNEQDERYMNGLIQDLEHTLYRYQRRYEMDRKAGLTGPKPAP